VHDLFTRFVGVLLAERNHDRATRAVASSVAEMTPAMEAAVLVVPNQVGAACQSESAGQPWSRPSTRKPRIWLNVILALERLGQRGLELALFGRAATGARSVSGHEDEAVGRAARPTICYSGFFSA